MFSLVLDRATTSGLTPAVSRHLRADAGRGDGNDGNPGGQVPTPTGAAVSAQVTALGTILVDHTGRTVYQFANDTTDTSCTDGACAATWPPVAAPTPLPSQVPGVTGPLGATTRPDGARQLTVAGHPLYTFAGDSGPGQTKGQNQTLNGGLWTVLSAAGAPVTRSAPAGGGDGGY